MNLKSLFSDIFRFLQYGDLPTSYFVKRGMKVGKNFNRQSGTRLDPSNCHLIEIGDDVMMGNKVQIIAHDFSTMHYTGYARFGRVVIGNRVFIGANSTILMNVHIGNDVVIGAGSLVNKDIPDGVVVAGVPARILCTIEEYVKKQNALIEDSPKLHKCDTTYGGKLTQQQKDEMNNAINNSPTRVVYAKFRDFRRLVGSGKCEKLHKN